MKMLLRAFLLVALAYAFTGCASTEKTMMQTDMSGFDRAYVPALVLTAKKGSGGEDVMAVKQLKQEWSIVRYKQSSVFESVADEVDSAIEDADRAVMSGRPEEANRRLMSIGKTMMHARRQFGIDYILDHFTEFSDTMERIYEIGEEGGRMPLTDAQMSELRILSTTAREQWATAMKAKFNPSEFRMNKNSAMALRKNMQAESDLIEKLALASSSGDTRTARAMAKEIKPGFYRTYKLFGNFNSISISQ